jgi:hypothetical protein
MSALAKKARTTYPDHDYADDHRLLKARAQLPARRKLRDAAEIRPCGEVACERIREFAWDVGAELREEQPNRWMAPIAREVPAFGRRPSDVERSRRTKLAASGR